LKSDYSENVGKVLTSVMIYVKIYEYFTLEEG